MRKACPGHRVPSNPCAPRRCGAPRLFRRPRTPRCRHAGETRARCGLRQRRAAIEARVAGLDRLLKLSDDLRSLDEAAERSEADLARIRREMEDVEKNIAALMNEAKSATEDEFRKRADIFKQRQRLIQEFERIP